MDWGKFHGKRFILCRKGVLQGRELQFKSVSRDARQQGYHLPPRNPPKEPPFTGERGLKIRPGETEGRLKTPVCGAPVGGEKVGLSNARGGSKFISFRLPMLPGLTNSFCSTRGFGAPADGVGRPLLRLSISGGAILLRLGTAGFLGSLPFWPFKVCGLGDPPSTRLGWRTVLTSLEALDPFVSLRLSLVLGLIRVFPSALEKRVPPGAGWVPGLTIEGVILWEFAAPGFWRTFWEAPVPGVEGDAFPILGAGAAFADSPRCWLSVTMARALAWARAVLSNFREVAG